MEEAGADKDMDFGAGWLLRQQGLARGERSRAWVVERTTNCVLKRKGSMNERRMLKGWGCEGSFGYRAEFEGQQVLGLRCPACTWTDSTGLRREAGNGKVIGYHLPSPR